LIPTITVIGLNFGALLGGAVLTETTFNLKGLGMLIQRSITGMDYYVLNAVVFIISLLFILVNLATDIIYSLVDPRIRY
jgi:peptide/nickel transport system permease protein